MVGLGEAEAADPLAAREFRQVFLLLPGRAELLDRNHHQRGLHRHHRAIAGIDALDLARDQAIGDIAEPRPAVIRRHRRPEKAEFAHLAEDRGVGLLLPERLQHARGEPVLGVGEGGLLDEALLFGELGFEAERVGPVERAHGQISQLARAATKCAASRRMSPSPRSPAASSAATASSTKASRKRLRAVKAVNGDEGALVALRVLAGALAELLRSRLGVENVVGDLESRAQSLAVAHERGAAARLRAGDDGAGLDGEAQQRPGLHRLQAADGGIVERRGGSLRLDVEHLSADHAAEAGGAGKAEAQRDADLGVPMGRGIGENVEGQRQQPVAGENGGRLVEGLVRRRPAAPEVVVVHRRQVVVDQRIAMHAFDGAAGAQRRPGLGAERPRGLDRQERAQPLAAAERAIAHGVEHALRPRDLAGQRRPGEDRVERRLDGLGDLVEAFGEIGAHAG